MIDEAYCRTMAAYSEWQNGSLVRAANGLTSSERWKDRGAFFGSIAATMNHLLWDDALWLARLSGDKRPEQHIPASIFEPSDWNTFKSMRQEKDQSLINWAVGLRPSDLAGEVIFAPGGGDHTIIRPRWMCIAHLFNHQTHHRGQTHAMLTAAGAEPDVTDLMMLPVPT